jgi:serine/threonine-protein kinase
MAVVFLGRQKSLDRLVAIKVLLPLLAYDPELVERFMREARTQGKLDHPNIINVFEVYNESGLTFFTVPFISGMSLRTYLKEDPQPPFSKVLRYLSQSADALAYAHRRGVVHRDVKPDNILIDVERDRLILTDFGIAKALAAETTLTTPGDLLGTPQYMSPEQGEGRQDLDGRADQYSLGLIGWEMLAGRRPFQADNLAELMYKHRFEEPDDIDEIRPDAPRNMRATIKRAISKDRDARFLTMEEFRAALEAPDTVTIEPPPAEEVARGASAADETVRIPTPPSMRRRASMERTAPESTQPSAAAPAEGDTDTTEPWTPSGRMPWEEAAAEAREPQESETALLGSVAERRTGPHKGLLVGGGLAVIVAAALLFVVGPFKAGRQAQTPAEVVPEAGRPAAAEGTGADDAAAAGQQGAVPEQPATDPASAQSETAQPPDPVPATQEPAVDQQPATQRDEGGTPTAAHSDEAGRAQSARSRVIDRRNAAIAAGAAASFRPFLDSLDALLADADRKMDSQSYGPARADFSRLILGYAALTDSARAAASAEAAAANAARSAADEARLAARAQREAVINAGGAVFLPGELEALNQRLNTAQRALDEGRFERARDAFQGLVGDYETLLDRVKAEGRAAADAAQQEMHDQRLAARQAGADDSAPQQLAAADNTRNRAFNAEQQERYGDAVAFYNQARDAYAQIVTNMAARPNPVSAEDQLAALIERFRVLFEQEDLDRMASEVYGGSIPEEDAGMMDYIFRQAEEISATSNIESIEVEETSATADAQLDLEIRNARTDQRSNLQLKLRFNFDFTPDGWRMRRMRRR